MYVSDRYECVLFFTNAKKDIHDRFEQNQPRVISLARKKLNIMKKFIEKHEREINLLINLITMLSQWIILLIKS